MERVVVFGQYLLDDVVYWVIGTGYRGCFMLLEVLVFGCGWYWWLVFVACSRSSDFVSRNVICECEIVLVRFGLRSEGG